MSCISASLKIGNTIIQKRLNRLKGILMHQYFFLNFREPHQVHVLVNFNQITLFYNCVAIDADK